MRSPDGRPGSVRPGDRTQERLRGCTLGVMSARHRDMHQPPDLVALCMARDMLRSGVGPVDAYLRMVAATDAENLDVTPEGIARILEAVREPH